MATVVERLKTKRFWQYKNIKRFFGIPFRSESSNNANGEKKIITLWYFWVLSSKASGGKNTKSRLMAAATKTAAQLFPCIEMGLLFPSTILRAFNWKLNQSSNFLKITLKNWCNSTARKKTFKQGIRTFDHNGISNTWANFTILKP